MGCCGQDKGTDRTGAIAGCWHYDNKHQSGGNQIIYCKKL